MNKAKIDSVFLAQTENRWNVAQASVQERIAKLKLLETWILDNKQAIRGALYADFKKPHTETDLTEIFSALAEARHAIKHIKRWARSHPVRRTMAMITTKSWLQYEARGIALIIAPWNYPFLLIVSPLISAIAAGNCVIIKPSEIAPNSSKLIAFMVEDLFPENEVAVMQGEKDVAIELLQKPFDHIFFTGSTAVGKKVMEAASKHLTSVTLELGGKSPVIVDKTANINDAAQKIVWSKFINCGQTCIAPDYVLIHSSIKNEFTERVKDFTQKFYGKNGSGLSASSDIARIINTDHFNRLKTVLERTVELGAIVEDGDSLNRADKYIPPTILTNISSTSPIMEEEIYGPILPIITYGDAGEAIGVIRGHPKPLALYIFSKEDKFVKTILKNTSSGGVCINDTIIHFSQTNLSFGGINGSGEGRSHGFHGFKEFSNEKAVLKHHRFSPLKLVYPPYTKRVQKIVDLMLKYVWKF